MLNRACVVVSFVLLTGVGSAWGRSPHGLPAVVRAKVAEMDKTCRQVGAKPELSPHLVIVADLTGDGVPDFVIDEGAYQCRGAASLFSGSAGSQMSVYVGTRDGQAFKAFSRDDFGVKIDRSANPARLYVGVGGRLCGQQVTPDMSLADYTTCWRPLVWDAKHRNMAFAPISMIKPYH
ncbi:MAG: hypothetical protein KGJ94_00740 [Xanthomonadaceae bacterium]|nr:hypothetical protein [Xanthomonadaceae bacterium]